VLLGGKGAHVTEPSLAVRPDVMASREWQSTQARSCPRVREASHPRCSAWQDVQAGSWLWQRWWGGPE